MSIYEDYGKLMVQLEIIQGKIQECKMKIRDEMQKPQVEVKEEPPKE